MPRYCRARASKLLKPETSSCENAREYARAFDRGYSLRTLVGTGFYIIARECAREDVRQGLTMTAAIANSHARAPIHQQLPVCNELRVAIMTLELIHAAPRQWQEQLTLRARPR